MTILIILSAYLVGCFPSAYLVTKIATHGKDIRRLGTGKLGTANVLDVTHSKPAAICTLLLDILKGVAIAWLASSLLGVAPKIFPALTLIAGVLGHNYNVFLRFSGGRGLAVSVGIFACINPLPIILWLVCWGVSRFRVKNLDMNNVFASAASAVLICLLETDDFNIACLADFVLPRISLLIAVVVINAMVIISYLKKR